MKTNEGMSGTLCTLEGKVEQLVEGFKMIVNQIVKAENDNNEHKSKHHRK